MSSDPLAIRGVVHAGLAVTMTSRLLAGHLADVRIVAIDGIPPRRSLYALLPDKGARPVDVALVEQLEVAAAGPV